MFPQLAPGLVLHLNNSASHPTLCEAVSEELVENSSLQHAMLFELAFAAGEQFIDGAEEVDWNAALAAATRRQRNHFDAKIPELLSDVDKNIASYVGTSLSIMVEDLSAGRPIIQGPLIPGYQWIASGRGDFSCGSMLIEVKCAARRFGAADYRQLLTYWLLSYSAAIEGRGEEWQVGVLINPRRNEVVELGFDDLIATVGGGRSKVDLLEHFAWLIGDHSARRIDLI
ncbi:hypothetical protein [Luteimonas sp. SDU82]|uniref:hypothetical protein n=1 Tax=Luteimonas sp. SDU82 TaxID=3422592 RepID=UPI003EB7F441